MTMNLLGRIAADPAISKRKGASRTSKRRKVGLLIVCPAAIGKPLPF